MRVTQFNIILLSLLTFISIGFIQCGDSAENGDSETAVLTITGNLIAPQVATESSSVSALISTATVDAAVDNDESDALDDLLTATGEAGCSVEVYTMEGLLVCSTVTGIAGEYVCPISDLNDIRPTDVTDPTVSFRPQLVASIDCGAKHYETFIGDSVDPTAPADLADNEATIKTTLAMQTMMTPDPIDFTGWGVDFSEVLPNPGQRYMTILGFFKGGSLNAESGSLGKQFGIMSALFTSFYVGPDKGDNSALGYASPYAMIKAMLAGELSSDAVTRMTGFLADNINGLDTSTIHSTYSSAASNLTSTRDLAYTNFIDAGLANLDEMTKEEFNALGKTYAKMSADTAISGMREGGSVTFEFIRDMYRTAATTAATIGADEPVVFNQDMVAGLVAGYGTNLTSHMANNKDTFINTMYKSASNLSCSEFSKCSKIGAAFKVVYDSQGLDYCSTEACYEGVGAYVKSTSTAGTDNITGYFPADTSYFESGAFTSCVMAQISAGLPAVSCMGWLSGSQQNQLSTFVGGGSGGGGGQPQLKADGQPCVQSFECLSNTCNAGLCGGQQQQQQQQIKKVDGQACTQPSECFSNACFSGICGKKTDGQACVQPSECVSNACNGGTCGGQPPPPPPPQNTVRLKNCAGGCEVAMSGNAPGPNQTQGFNITNAVNCAGLPQNVNVTNVAGPPNVFTGANNLFTATWNGALQNHPTDPTLKIQPCNGVLQGQACGICSIIVPAPPQ